MAQAQEVIWSRVRQWGAIRGIDKVKPQVQYQRFLQEAVEIHEALVNDDAGEFIDAIGDTIVTLINLANTKGLNAEDCLNVAFTEIEKRKGLTTSNGDFKRYGKLDTYSKAVCDDQQGNSGSEFFVRNDLQPADFRLRGTGGLV